MRGARRPVAGHRGRSAHWGACWPGHAHAAHAGRTHPAAMRRTGEDRGDTQACRPRAWAPASAYNCTARPDGRVVARQARSKRRNRARGVTITPTRCQRRLPTADWGAYLNEDCGPEDSSRPSDAVPQQTATALTRLELSTGPPSRSSGMSRTEKSCLRPLRESLRLVQRSTSAEDRPASSGRCTENPSCP